jgi:hypothetical protein
MVRVRVISVFFFFDLVEVSRSCCDESLRLFVVDVAQSRRGPGHPAPIAAHPVAIVNTCKRQSPKLVLAGPL